MPAPPEVNVRILPGEMFESRLCYRLVQADNLEGSS